MVALSDEGESKVQPHLEKNKISYIVGSGAGSTVKAYGVKGLPSVFLIGPDGKIAWKGHPAVVKAELVKLLKKSPPKKKGFLAEKSAKAAYRKALKLYDKRSYAKALQALQDVSKQFRGTEYAKKGKAKIKKMKANSRIMEIIKKEAAERVSKGWLEAARVLAQYGDKKDALKYYKRILKKYPDTDYAKLARDEKKALQGSD